MIPEDFKFKEGQVFELTKDGETERAIVRKDTMKRLILIFYKENFKIYLTDSNGSVFTTGIECLNNLGITFVPQQENLTSGINTNLTPSYHIVTENIQLSQLAEYLIQQLTIELDRCKQSTEKYNKLKTLFDNND